MLYSWSLQSRVYDEEPDFLTCFARHEHCQFDVPSAWDLSYNKTAIGVVLSGCFEYRTSNGTITGVPGSIIFGNPHESFVVRHSGRTANRRLVLWYDTSFIEGIAAGLDLDSARVPCVGLPPGRTASAIFAQLQSIARENDLEKSVDLAVTALTARDQHTDTISISEPDRKWIMSAVRYIEANYSEPCTVDELSAACGMNRYRFMRTFKDVIGQTVNQYVIGTRLREAVLRLRNSNEPISDVALNVGFNDISHFNASFRAAFGAAPRHMRYQGRSTITLPKIGPRSSPKMHLPLR